MSLVRSVLIHCAVAKLYFKVGMMVMETAEMEIEMTSYLQKIIVVFIAVVALPAWAGHNNNRYPEPGSQYSYAKVVNAQPIFEMVQIPEERRVCREQVVRRRVDEHRSPGPAIFGAVLGGVIGNQISRGHSSRHGHRYSNNRAAATFAGAAIGGAVASGIQYNRYPPRYYSENANVCEIETSWRNERQIVAWDVSWKYRGRIYHSRMAEPPGDRIRVRVNVNPVYQ